MGDPLVAQQVECMLQMAIPELIKPTGGVGGIHEFVAWHQISNCGVSMSGMPGSAGFHIGPAHTEDRRMGGNRHTLCAGGKSGEALWQCWIGTLMNERQRRSDTVTAKAVARGVNIQSVRNRALAQKYMEYRRVPSGVIARVLDKPLLRRAPSNDQLVSEAITPSSPPPTQDRADE
ncbi:hypothetical protein [Pseudoduganella violaceinigra]|uniref:hypothetical protein n=1 Tax=Pseudoduganella violaceinigra TaxID=246602 RepID=UPI001E5AA90A|nr:hypothetical protein [Pseudoduganella violaceinigra]